MQDAPLSYPELSLPDIGGLPAAGTLVLTVNNRLARRLTLELAGLLRAERQVSELPRIVPLSAWLAESANELAFDAGGDMPAYRLDSFATQMVWTEAIRAEEAERVLLDARQAARLAMDADLLMDEWELRVPSGADTDEYKGFARWRLRYREALAELDAEDANQGYARVLDALGQGRLATPQRLVLAGFTEVSPRFARLLDAFAAQGSDIGQWRDAQRAPRSRVASRPRIRAASGAPPRVGPRRNCRSIRQVATPSSRRNWKPNPCSPGACWARRWPAATARPRWRSTWPWAGHWMNGRWRARRWPGCARWPNARTARAAACRRWAPRCWPAIAPAMCASVRACPPSTRAGGAMPASASARRNGAGSSR